jgi:hypothetical protein
MNNVPVQRRGSSSGTIILCVIAYVIFAPFLPLCPIDEFVAIIIGAIALLMDE